MNDTQMFRNMELAQKLGELLLSHDQRKGDQSLRAEGSCQAIVILAEFVEFDLCTRQQLVNSIRACFKQYNQRAEENRSARKALEILEPTLFKATA